MWGKNNCFGPVMELTLWIEFKITTVKKIKGQSNTEVILEKKYIYTFDVCKLQQFETEINQSWPFKVIQLHYLSFHTKLKSNKKRKCKY